MCIIKLKIPLALEENVSFVPVQQKYLLFIVEKFATFCVTFLTEVKRNKQTKKEWSLVCGISITNNVSFNNLQLL